MRKSPYILKDKRRALRLEGLEPRVMMDANALLWGGDAHLSISFAPDGTKIGGVSSSLFSSFNAVSGTADWQGAILQAFQTWAVESNAGVGLVADSGADFGVSGASRSDPRFGDI